MGMSAQQTRLSATDMIFAVLEDGHERTLWGIEGDILSRFGRGVAQTSISARIRDGFGKDDSAYPEYRIEKRECGRGRWFYSMVRRETQ